MMRTDITIEEKLELGAYTTPRGLRSKPIHRWFVFPHSYTSDLVRKLVNEWNLKPEDRILDPFVGAGTTILAAKECAIPASGYDLSPLAVFVTRVKVTSYDIPKLRKVWQSLEKAIGSSKNKPLTKTYSDLVQKALPGQILTAFDNIEQDINLLDANDIERNFLRLALLSLIPQYSRAVATGGWLKWIEKDNDASTIIRDLSTKIGVMLDDVATTILPVDNLWEVNKADVRELPDEEARYSAVITSPPYPNRHDYTRVFGVELMLAFLDWEGTRKLRYQSFQSHPESHPIRPNTNGYFEPLLLTETLARIAKKTKEHRIPDMLRGYFLDMYLSLREINRVCSENARIAFILGDARYYGEDIPVGELTAEVGEETGLLCEKIIVARYRGNSAQQMGKYGRRRSPETIVVFRKTHPFLQ